MAGKEQRLENLLDSFVAAGVPGCALAVSYKGKVVYSGYRGFENAEEKRPVDADTVYQLASCTKVICAAAAMKLVEEGKILLNDPVENYLPFFKDLKYQYQDGGGEVVLLPTTKKLTIKHLMTMTSGIPSAGNGSPTAVAYRERIGFGRDLTLMELSKRISEIPLESDPGTHWRYGIGFDVLACIMEVVTGKRLGDYLKEAFFDPLGMTHTTYALTEEMNQHLAGVYSLSGGKLVKKNTVPAVAKEGAPVREFASGGLLSTISDLVRFAGMMAQGGSWEGKRILSSRSINLMSQNHLQGTALEDFKRMGEHAYPWYKGYGWGLAGRTLIDPQEAGSIGSVGEFGWCGAFGPYFLIDPSTGLGVIYAHQMFPVIGGMQDHCHPRVRNVVYSLLDQWEGQ